MEIRDEERIALFVSKWQKMANFKFKNKRLVIRKKIGFELVLWGLFIAVGIFIVRDGGLISSIVGYFICLLSVWAIIEEEIYPLLVLDLEQKKVQIPGLFRNKKFGEDEIKAFKAIPVTESHTTTHKGYKSKVFYVVQSVWLITNQKQEVKLFRIPGRDKMTKNFTMDLAYLLANTFRKRVRR